MFVLRSDVLLHAGREMMLNKINFDGKKEINLDYILLIRILE